LYLLLPIDLSPLNGLLDLGVSESQSLLTINRFHL